MTHELQEQATQSASEVLTAQILLSSHFHKPPYIKLKLSGHNHDEYVTLLETWN